MKDYEKSAAFTLIHLVRQWDQMTSDQRASADGNAVYEKIRIAGHTASFFGGYQGMRKLHDACEKLTGDNNEIGYHLNDLWDMIGGWLR